MQKVRDYIVDVLGWVFDKVNTPCGAACLVAWTVGFLLGLQVAS